MSINFANPIAIQDAIPRARLKNLRSWRPFAKSSFSAVSAVQRTFSTVWPVPGGFDLVRLAYVNDATGSTWALDKAAVAPSAQLTNGYTPLDSGGSSVSFTAVTFNNAGADGLSPSPSGSTATVTVPVAPSVEQYGWAYSDWMRVASLDRSDGGTHPLLMARTVISTASRIGQNISDLAGWATEGLSFNEFQCYYKSGDFVTTPSGFTSPTTGGGFMVPHALQWYSRALGGTVMAIGDSITEGSATASLNAGFGFIACEALSTAAKPVVFWNGGFRSQTSAGWYERGKAQIDVVRPEVVIIAPWTPNDPSTQADGNLAFSRAMDLAYYSMTKGAVPILWTPIPANLAATPDGYRANIASRVRALSGAWLVADFETAISTGATPNRIQAQYDSGDGVHPNNAGHAAMAAVLEPLLARALY